MNKQRQDIALFVSFCLEEYKTAKGIAGEDALKVFLKYGLMEYLSEFFDVLHTQSRQWILEDIDEYINIRKEKEVAV